MKNLFAATAIATTALFGVATMSSALAQAQPAPAATAQKKEMKASAGPWLGTQVWKQGVYDPKETRIGEIDNLVISNSGQVTEAVIGVGGFLGLGEKAVAVPFSSLKPMVRDGQIWFVLNKTKDELKAAPAFDTSKYKH